MQLGEAKTLGMLDHHDRGIGNVDADFDHRCRHQDLDAALGEGGHGGVFFRALHSAMNQSDLAGK